MKLRTLKGWRACVGSSLLAIAIALVPVSASAESNLGEDLGLGLGAAVCSLVYAPVKIVYAFGGLVIGGFGWVLSGGDDGVVKSIVDPAVRGDYIITPDNLRGRQPIEFFGGAPRDSASDPSSPDW